MNFFLKCEYKTQIYPPTEVSGRFCIDHGMNQTAPYEVKVIQKKNTNWWVVVWVITQSSYCICSLHFSNLKSFLIFRHRASCIQDRSLATLQRTLFII